MRSASVIFILCFGALLCPGLGVPRPQDDPENLGSNQEDEGPVPDDMQEVLDLTKKLEVLQNDYINAIKDCDKKKRDMLALGTLIAVDKEIRKLIDEINTVETRNNEISNTLQEKEESDLKLIYENQIATLKNKLAFYEGQRRDGVNEHCHAIRQKREAAAAAKEGGETLGEEGDSDDEEAPTWESVGLRKTWLDKEIQKLTDKLKAQEETCSQELAELAEILAKAEEDVSQANNKKAELENKLKEAKDTTTDLENKLAATDEELDKLLKQLNEEKDKLVQYDGDQECYDYLETLGPTN